MDVDNIIFKDRVLDSVHGFIYYTEAEEKIIQTTSKYKATKYCKLGFSWI